MNIKKVGIVGCGQMGSGIVQLCAQAGFDVIVSEVNETLLKKGLSLVNFSLDKGIERGKLSLTEKETILNHIQGTTKIADFKDCDLVIEAAIENIDLKKKIFSELDNLCPKNCILATNTSCLAIIDISVATKRPEKILGLHFFNPVAAMKLLEIVTTIATSRETLEAGKAFGKSLNKTIVVSKDSPGFIVNRLAMPFILNGIRMYESGFATREDIDTAINLGLNHPMGPLALADFIGLDTIYFAVSAIYEELKDPQYAPPVLLKKMLVAGWLGRKTGKGFYEYK